MAIILRAKGYPGSRCKRPQPNVSLPSIKIM